MDAAIEINPDWVIRNACRRAESIMDAGKAKYYDEAVEWLKKARDAYVASDKEQEWSDYRTELITIHGRKYKLMGLNELPPACYAEQVVSSFTGDCLSVGLRPRFGLTSPPLAESPVPEDCNILIPSALMFLAAFSSLSW